jgi:hypothetical protein
MRTLARAIRDLTSVSLVVFAHLGANTASAQYRNLDAGRPSRIEDAEPTPRFALDIDLGPFQVERLSGGTMRYRAEPRLAFGVLPMTDIELRAPLVQVSPPSTSGSTSAAGLAGVSVGVMRALTIETTSVPAMAVAAEMSLPVGGLAPTRGSYLAKALLTKTTGLARIHLNAGFGTYALYTAPPRSGESPGCTALVIIAPGDTACTTGLPIVIDAPCSANPRAPGRLDEALRRCMPPANQSIAPAAPSLPSGGNRWFAGAAVDHAFALQSVLVIADVYAERFLGLYPNTDWTAEAGLRYQLTPLLVLDVGAGRHFAGTIRSTLLTLGATYELATPALFGR